MSDQNPFSFRDLIAWRNSHDLSLRIYRLSLRNPNIRNQIERSSLSVSSNIAEGFGRNSIKDKEHFYIMARGSSYEVQSQLILAYDLGLIREADFNELIDLSIQSIKLLHGLIKSNRSS